MVISISWDLVITVALIFALAELLFCINSKFGVSCFSEFK